MAAGADMSAVSMHKSGGSLTQSSILLTGRDVNADYVRQIINLTQTTSASYLLLSSLDIYASILQISPNSIWISYSSRSRSYTSIPASPISSV